MLRLISDFLLINPSITHVRLGECDRAIAIGDYFSNHAGERIYDAAEVGGGICEIIGNRDSRLRDYSLDFDPDSTGCDQKESP